MVQCWHVGSCNGWDLLFDVKIRLCAATPIIKFLAPLSLLIQPQTGFRFLCHFTRVARVHCTLVFILFCWLVTPYLYSPHKVKISSSKNITSIWQAYKFDLFSTTCVSRLVEPLSFFLEFCHKAGNFEELDEFHSRKFEFIEGSGVFLYENAMDFW